MKTIIILSTFFITLSVIQGSHADEIIYTAENSLITEEVTWTTDNTYRIQTELTIWLGGRLTVEAGTRVTIEAPSFDEEDHDIVVRLGGEITVIGTSSKLMVRC